jgi:hypothetical protein
MHAFALGSPHAADEAGHGADEAPRRRKDGDEDDEHAEVRACHLGNCAARGRRAGNGVREQAYTMGHKQRTHVDKLCTTTKYIARTHHEKK